MLLHRYKVKFGHVSDGIGANRKVLVAWFVIGLLVAFIPAGRAYGMFFPSIFLCFFELLIVFLAQENKFFQRAMPWMLFLMGMMFIVLYFTEEIWSEGFHKVPYPYLRLYEKEFNILALSIWHFIAYLISLITAHFNNKLKKDAEQNTLFN